jgi:NAD(P)-dependent dehydrogenase (short-subunit alcohol dehydrogenase family)
MSQDTSAVRVALVTGGTRGIGRAIALGLARAGRQVAVAGRGTEAGEALVAEIVAGGGEAIFHRTDVAEEADVQALVNATVSAFGRLDLACNCAGVEGELAPLVDQRTDEVRRLLDVNVLGVFLCMKHQIPAMLQRDGGAIVNVSSIAGLKGVPHAAPYCASKHAVLGLTRSAALEYGARGIRVNAVCPGFVETDMGHRLLAKTGLELSAFASPLGRVAQPGDVASAVLWLLSDAAGFINGQAVPVDGGSSVQ